MRRAWVPLACGLLQVVSVSTGPTVDPEGWRVAVFVAAGLLAAAALAARQRRPLPVLAVATLGQAVQVLLVGPVFPVVTTVAACTVARTALLPSGAPALPAGALAGSAVVVAGTVSAVGHTELAAPYALMVVLGVLAGLVLAVRAARAGARRRELVLAERLRIARDLHDAVGHGMGAITVQAGAGRMAVAAGASQEATRALLAIEEASRAVLRDVRWMVGLLRDDAERPRLRDVPELVVAARRSGLTVTLDEDGDLGAVADDVGEAAYRIVQEAVSNVVRHSDVTDVAVRLVVGPDLELAVHDGGSASSARPEQGHGLRGMQERAAAVGGQVVAGPDPAGGWSVRATLPAHGRSR